MKRLWVSLSFLCKMLTTILKATLGNPRGRVGSRLPPKPSVLTCDSTEFPFDHNPPQEIRPHVKKKKKLECCHSLHGRFHKGRRKLVVEPSHRALQQVHGPEEPCSQAPDF